MKIEDMEDVYKQNVNTVYRYIFCLTKDAHMAEEMTQETFYQASKGVGSFRGEAKISSWLCGIAKRIWYKEISGKKETVPLEEDMHSDEGIEGDFLLKLDKMELFKLMHQFAPEVKEVMYLRLTGMLSFSEIGDILGKSEVWARVTYYRGKQSLKERDK